MKITRVSSQRLKEPDRRARYIMTKENPYVMLDRKQHYWDETEGKTLRAPVLNKDQLIRLISTKYGNKLGVKQTSQFNRISNIRLYFNADAKGYKYFASNLDLRGKYKNISMDEIEKLLIDDIEKWIEGNTDRISLVKDLEISSEDPNDMPPIDNGLDENDFKL
tara:strand:- start:232 stop:723 length:492 start_codon:yes stop_codon:yes gene_type:complete